MSAPVVQREKRKQTNYMLVCIHSIREKHMQPTNQNGKIFRFVMTIFS